MPGNGEAFEAFTATTGCVKREWFQEEGGRRNFKIYSVNSSEVYHTLKGRGLMSAFESVINCLNYCIQEEYLT